MIYDKMVRKKIRLRRRDINRRIYSAWQWTKTHWKIAVPCAALLIGAIVLVIALTGEKDASPAPQGQTLHMEALLPSPSPSPSPTPTPVPTPTPTPTPTPDPTLKRNGEDSERTAELQMRLMDLGYMEADEPTQHFGPVTEYAVQLFQRQHSLQEDGIAGEMTLGLIFSGDAKKYTLLEGTRGDDVTSFQSQLQDLGYLNKATGYYGDETVAAVKAFQKNNGLSADGKAGEHTIERINSDDAKASPQKAREKRRSANVNEMIAIAKSKLGSRYRLGHKGPDTFDCSGFVYYCLREAGSNRRRLTSKGYSQVGDWEKITSTSKLQKGDLLFFLNNGRTEIGHVGIYIGSGQMIDASSGNGKVVRRSISSSYWKKNFTHARRPW